MFGCTFAAAQSWNRVALCTNEVVAIVFLYWFCEIFIGPTMGAHYCPTTWLQSVLPITKTKNQITSISALIDKKAINRNEVFNKFHLPIWEEVNISPGLFDAQYANIGVNYVDELSIAPLKSVQAFSFIKTWSKHRKKPYDSPKWTDRKHQSLSGAFIIECVINHTRVSTRHILTLLGPNLQMIII